MTKCWNDKDRNCENDCEAFINNTSENEFKCGFLNGIGGLQVELHNITEEITKSPLKFQTRN